MAHYYVSMVICKRCFGQKNKVNIPCIRSVGISWERTNNEQVPPVEEFKKNLEDVLNKSQPPCIEQGLISPKWEIIDYNIIPQEFTDPSIVNKCFTDSKEDITKSSKPNRFNDLDLI